MEKCEKAYAASKSYKPTTKEWLTSIWNGFPSPSQIANETFSAEPTGISKDALVKVANALVNIPDGFHPHKGIVRLLKEGAKCYFLRTDLRKIMTHRTIVMERRTRMKKQAQHNQS